MAVAVAEDSSERGGWVVLTTAALGLTVLLVALVLLFGGFGGYALSLEQEQLEELLTQSEALTGEVNGEERAAELLDAELPWGLELVESGRRPAGGEVVLRFENGGESELDAAAETDAASDDEAERARPVEVLLVEYKGQGSVGGLFPREGDGEGGGRRRRRRRGTDDETQSVSERLVKWNEDPSEDWHATVERGELRWGDWSADYAVERSFREGGTWADLARVNLAEPDRPLVLFARYPDGVEANEEDLEVLAGCVRLLAEE